MKYLRAFSVSVLLLLSAMPSVKADPAPDVKTDFSAVQDQSPNLFRYYEAPDPIEGYNRVMYSFNAVVIGYVINPLGKFYSFIVPEYGRKGIARMADNIEMPGRLINSMLQARWKRAEIELARFGVNTTLGVVGFWDFADEYMGMLPQTNSFGMTFAYWGIGPGFYIVLPIQGSTTLRDGIGLIFDWFADPLTYIPPYTIPGCFLSTAIKFAIEFSDMTLVIDDYIRIQESSRDPYETFKVFYFAQKIITMHDLKTNGLIDENTDTIRNEDKSKHE